MKFLRQPAFQIDKGKPSYDDSQSYYFNAHSLAAVCSRRERSADQKEYKHISSQVRDGIKAKPQSGATKSKTPAKSAGAAIFLVTQDRSGAHIAPLVGVIESRLIEPPSAESETFSEFASRYYRAGQKYSLAFWRRRGRNGHCQIRPR